LLIDDAQRYLCFEILNKKRRAFCLSVDSDCEKWMRALDLVQSLPPFLHHSLPVNGCSNRENERAWLSHKTSKVAPAVPAPEWEQLASKWRMVASFLASSLGGEIFLDSDSAPQSGFRLINQNGIPKVASECRFSEQ
jgi:hypothetical protein